jgi:hypothetical protein
MSGGAITNDSSREGIILGDKLGRFIFSLCKNFESNSTGKDICPLRPPIAHSPGNEIVCDMGFATLCLTVCFDLRFSTH